jgi:hypothetical protein
LISRQYGHVTDDRNIVMNGARIASVVAPSTSWSNGRPHAVWVRLPTRST